MWTGPAFVTADGPERAFPKRPEKAPPCAYCGRPVPQPDGLHRLLRYCQDTDGACERGAADKRERDRFAPGLTGQIAQMWDLVERLEEAADFLARSLRAELSVSGTERRIAEIQARAAAEVEAAAREKEAARTEVTDALASIAYHRQRADTAEAQLGELRQGLKDPDERDLIIRDLRALVAKLAAVHDVRRIETAASTVCDLTLPYTPI